jgi:hypothetical protein
LQAVVTAAAQSELTVSEAGGVASIIGGIARAIELVEIDQRLTKLEEQQQGGGS